MVNPFPSHSLFVLSSVGRPRCENMTLTCNGRQLSAYPAAPAEKQHSWRLAKNGSIRPPAKYGPIQSKAQHQPPATLASDLPPQSPDNTAATRKVFWE